MNASVNCSIIINSNSIYNTDYYFIYNNTIPSVYSVSPLRGGTGGGTLLSIVGSGFGLDKTLLKVIIANTECSIVNLTSTEITCYTGSYRNSHFKDLIKVYIEGVGLALNVNLLTFSFCNDIKH